MTRCLALAFVLLLLCGTAASAERAGAATGASSTAPLRLTMRAAEDMALARRPELTAAIAEIAMQNAELARARAQLQPAASVSLFGVSESSGMIYTTAPSVMPTFYTMLGSGATGDVNVTAMVPLYTGGRLQDLVAAGRHRLRAAREMEKAEVLDVVLDVRKRWLEAVYQRDLVRVAEDRVAEEAEDARLDELLFKYGRVAEVVEFRGRAELADARQRLNDARNAAETALIELKLALGTAQQPDVALNGGLVEGLGEVPPALPALVERAQRQRPDLRAAGLAVLEAEAEKKAARAEYSPGVYFAVMGESSRSTSAPGVGGGASAGVVVSLPLLDGGDRHAQVAYASSSRDRAAAREERLREAVARDVARARVAMETQAANVSLAEAAVKAAQENDRIARLRFKNGKGIQLEVLDAAAALEQARDDLLKAQYEWQVAHAELRWSLGER